MPDAASRISSKQHSATFPSSWCNRPTCIVFPTFTHFCNYSQVYASLEVFLFVWVFYVKRSALGFKKTLAYKSRSEDTTTTPFRLVNLNNKNKVIIKHETNVYGKSHCRAANKRIGRGCSASDKWILAPLGQFVFRYACLPTHFSSYSHDHATNHNVFLTSFL